MLRRLIPLTFVLAGASAALADDMKMATNSGDLKWGPATAALPKGAEITVLSGASKDGLYVVRLKVPDGYKIPAHNHPTTEYVTVISGNFHLGMGDKLDEKNGIELTAGGFGAAPAKMNTILGQALHLLSKCTAKGRSRLHMLTPRMIRVSSNIGLNPTCWF